MNHHSAASRHSTTTRSRYRSSFLLIAFATSVPGLYGEAMAQQGLGIQVAVEWHTEADPMFGASYHYAWNDIHVTSKEGVEIATPIELSIGRDDGGGCFTLLSQPITVPSSGMVITFDREVIMHPSTAERGTSLPNDPKDKCRYQELGINRAVFLQRIDVVDAVTGEVLASRIDECRFGISRHQVLDDITDNKQVTLDLSPLTDRRVKIRTWIAAGYNGRGPARATTPRIDFITRTTRQDFK